jgi:nitroreductase
MDALKERALPRPEGKREEPARPVELVSRRTLLQRAGLGLGTVLVAGSGALGYRAYDQGVLEVGQGPAYAPWSSWREQEGVLRLIGAAVLAPSPHNAQGWLFRVSAGRVDLYADRSRWTGATDPFRREQYVGLGAALENLVLAAEADGYAPRVRLLPEGAGSSHVARIELARSSPRASTLYAQIPQRHTNRYAYVEGKAVSAAALSAMAGLADSTAVGTRLFWFTGAGQRGEIGDLLVQATEALIADPDQSASDFAWFRQSWDEIQRQRDGITVDAAGLSDLVAALGKLLPAQSRTATDDAWLTATRDRQTKTAAGYGIVAVRDAQDDRQRLQGGRLLERIHLWATGNGLALQHMNQLTERADRELQLALAPRFGDALRQLLPSGWQALSTFRVGYPTHAPHKSPRRAVSAVILA